MIVGQVNVIGVLSFKTECDSPISGHVHGPVTFQVAFQRVKVEARHIHVVGVFCRIQSGQNGTDTVEPLGIDPLCPAFLVQSFYTNERKNGLLRFRPEASATARGRLCGDLAMSGHVCPFIGSLV